MAEVETQDRREGSLFGAHRGSVSVREGVDLIAPVFDVERDVTKPELAASAETPSAG
jgi:hypothetical protein